MVAHALSFGNQEYFGNLYRGERMHLASCKASFVVPADVAPDEPPIEVKWLREKPMLVFKHSYQKIKHLQSVRLILPSGID